MSETTLESSRDDNPQKYPSQSQCHRVLADERRRVLLTELEGHTEPISLDALTSKIVDRERYDGGQRATESLRISLHHLHLPMLDELGIVSYDTEEHVVEPRRPAIDGLVH